MVSVIGLAPIRPDLKGRLRELLSIHGRKWSPRLVSRQRLLVFSEALICLSYSGKKTLQAPASKFHRSSKIQSPKPKARGSYLMLGAWSLSGIWSLGFGPSAGWLSRAVTLRGL